MRYFELIILILACYRLARLVAVDEGPAGLFMWLRVKAGAYDLQVDGQAETNLGRGISCVHCVAIWIALPLALVTAGLNLQAFWYWLAIAGGASVLWSLSNDN